MQIDLGSGHCVDTDLSGNMCTTADQKQRTYPVHCDDEFIWCASRGI